MEGAATGAEAERFGADRPSCASTDQGPGVSADDAYRPWHLWVLPDGTGLHAPLGQLVREDQTGRLCCHLCGRWFRFLGAHVRRHGYTAQGYREAMSLNTTVALSSAELSEQIAKRSARRYQNDDRLQQAFAPGQVMARSGRLGPRANQRSQTGVGTEPIQRVTGRRAALHRGRQAVNARRELALRDLVAQAGADDLHDFLRRAYTAGASLQTLAQTTGLGRARLSAAMTAAGISRRRTGTNTVAGKSTRARRADDAAALHVGTADIRTWLRDRYAQGASMSALAQAVGHSSHWVRWRLEDVTHGDGDTSAAL